MANTLKSKRQIPLPLNPILVPFLTKFNHGSKRRSCKMSSVSLAASRGMIVKREPLVPNSKPANPWYSTLNLTTAQFTGGRQGNN